MAQVAVGFVIGIMLFAGCAGTGGPDADADGPNDESIDAAGAGDSSDQDAAAETPRENTTFVASHTDFDLPPRFGFFVNVTAVGNATCDFSLEGSGSFGNESVNLASLWLHRDARGNIDRVSGLMVARGTGIQAFGVSADAAFSNTPMGYTAGSGAAPTLSANESIQWLLVATALDDPGTTLKFRFACEGDFDVDDVRWTKSFDALQPGSFSDGVGMTVPAVTKSINETAARHVAGPIGSIHAVFFQSEEGPLTSDDGELVVRTPNQTAIWRIHESTHTAFGWIWDIAGGPGDYSVTLDYEAIGASSGYVIIADWETLL